MRTAPVWGDDLRVEHERFLADTVARAPVVITDYPAAIKPFYMRRNADGRTVAAMDVLVPGVGELAGGSQREERPDVLAAAMAGMGETEHYQGYMALRRYGTVPHAGFGLGLERLVGSPMHIAV